MRYFKLKSNIAFHISIPISILLVLLMKVKYTIPKTEVTVIKADEQFALILNDKKLLETVNILAMSMERKT